jgi:CDK-activating kinase assembly factor MAT1
MYSTDHSAFNLLNDIDLVKTEARIAQFQKQNAEIIASNKQNALLEAMGQQERDELEKRAREERMEMVANAERMDRELDERAKGQIGEALVCDPLILLTDG